MHIPRSLTIEEFDAVVKVLPSASPEDEGEIRSDLIGAAVAVFDNYIIRIEGFTGKLCVIVWSGDLDLITLVGWQDGVPKQIQVGV